MIHRPGNQADACRRHRFHFGVFGNFDRRSVREHDFDASISRAQAVALHERHILRSRDDLAFAFERRFSFDHREVCRRRRLLRPGHARKRKQQDEARPEMAKDE